MSLLIGTHRAATARSGLTKDSDADNCVERTSELKCPTCVANHVAVVFACSCRVSAPQGKREPRQLWKPPAHNNERSIMQQILMPVLTSCTQKLNPTKLLPIGGVPRMPKKIWTVVGPSSKQKGDELKKYKTKRKMHGTLWANFRGKTTRLPTIWCGICERVCGFHLNDLFLTIVMRCRKSLDVVCTIIAL